MMSSPDPHEIQTLARALSDPTRFRIFWHITGSDEPVGVAELADCCSATRLGLPGSTTSLSLAKGPHGYQ